MEKFFTPPAEYAVPLETLRSPLLFDDGTPVKTPADWARRRAEIRRNWTALAGEWPALIQRPKVEILETVRRENFTQQKVLVEVAGGVMLAGYLLVPDGKGPFPAVVVPYYEPETSVGLGKEPLRDFGLQLTRRGFVSLSVGSPGGDARKPDRYGATCQPLMYLGCVAANCLNALAAMPEVDPKRIGIVGHSYGGKWAMFASCFYEKFACAAWSDGGVVFDEERSNVNYWEPWYLGFQEGSPRKPGLVTPENPRTGAYAELVRKKHDLHELHALMAPRPFLVSGGSEDFPARWRALAHAVTVNDLLGVKNRVAMTNRKDHTPTEESNAQIYAFFEHFLKEGAEKTSVADQAWTTESISAQYGNFQRITIHPCPSESSTLAFYCETEPAWWGDLRVFKQAGDRVEWAAAFPQEYAEACGHYVVSCRWMSLDVVGNPVLEIFDSTHMGNGSLWLLELRERKLRVLLHAAVRGRCAGMETQPGLSPDWEVKFAGEHLKVDYQNPEGSAGPVTVSLSGSLLLSDAAGVEQPHRFYRQECLWNPVRRIFLSQPPTIRLTQHDPGRERR